MSRRGSATLASAKCLSGRLNRRVVRRLLNFGPPSPHNTNHSEMISDATRQARLMFMSYLGAVFVCVLMAAPLVLALEPNGSRQGGAGAQARSQASASAGASSSAIRYPSFEECDRNRDGHLDKSEAGAVPGLSANFERADTNKDGRLDREEYDRALALLDSQRK